MNGIFNNVEKDVGRCSGNCQGRCVPAKTTREIIHLYSGPKEIEIIDSCECLMSNVSTCSTVKKEVTYFQGTSCQATVNVNQCVGSCGGMYIHSIYASSMTCYILLLEQQLTFNASQQRKKQLQSMAAKMAWQWQQLLKSASAPLNVTEKVTMKKLQR